MADIACAELLRAPDDPGARPGAVSAVRAFTAELYRRLAVAPGNLVCSPYSVAQALSMTWNGARGRTASEMQSVLRAPDVQPYIQGLDSLSRLLESRTGQVQRVDDTMATISLDVACSLWGQQGIRWEQPFLVDLARYYGTGIRLVDYVADPVAARTRINAWTADQTHDRIVEIIPPDLLDEQTRLLLVNAIYLKAAWEEAFNRSLTKRQQFTRSDGSQVDAEMMTGRLHLAGYGSGPGWRAVRLPYVGGRLAMTVVVPDGSLVELEKTLDPATLASLLHAATPAAGVLLHLPRWRFELTASLEEDLSEMGMPTAFDAATADFSAMTTQQRLHIGAVLHQANITVDESGTEAAAASAVIMVKLSYRGPPVELTADRPFLFVIHDVETATPLFIGRVEDPTAS